MRTLAAEPPSTLPTLFLPHPPHTEALFQPFKSPQRADQEESKGIEIGTKCCNSKFLGVFFTIKASRIYILDIKNTICGLKAPPIRLVKLI